MTSSVAQPVDSSSLRPILCLLILPVYLLHTWRFNFLCDDAFISFRYARNLADGWGLRFNPGESPPVEGFSNFLWVLVLSVCEGLGLSPVVWSRVLSVSCGVLLIILLLRYLHGRLGLPAGVVFLAGLFLALFPPLAVWSTGGLATVPFALLVFLTFERLLGDADRPRVISTGLAGLGVVLMRADGFAWVLALGVVAGLVLWRRGRRDLLVRLWPAAAMVLVGSAIFLGWRRWYFGEWFSNSTYAKADLTAFTIWRGWNYSVRFVLHFLSVGVILVAVLMLPSRARGGAVLGSGLMLAAVFSAAILVGGDFMPFGRMFVVGAPFVAILLAGALNRLWQAALWRRVSAAALAVGCMVLSLLPVFEVYLVPAQIRESFRFRWAFFRQMPEYVPLSELLAWQRSKDNCANWARTGRALRLVAEEGASLVQGGIGAVGYYSNLHIYDLAGLVDGEVSRRPPAPERHSAGHDRVVPLAFFEKYDPTYVYAVLGRRGPGFRNYVSQVQAKYLHRPTEGDLKDRYGPVVISLPAGKEFDEGEVLIVGQRHPR